MAAPETTERSRRSSEHELQREATLVLEDIRAAFRALLAQLPGAPHRSRDLETGLCLHKSLAWRVIRIAHSRAPLLDAHYIPGSEGVDIFLAAAASAGATADAIHAVRQALARFQELMDAQSLDRASLEVMLRALADERAPSADLRAARRAAYRCGSYTWGVQSKAHVLAAIYTPVGDGLADLATVRGHARLRLVRRDGHFVLSRTVESDTDDPGVRRARVAAIEPEGVLQGVPLLRDFCTTPFPALEAVPTDGNNVDYRFAEHPLGERGAVTVYTGEIRRALAGCLKRNEANTVNALILGVRRPVEIGVVDMWFPTGLFSPHQPRGMSLCALNANPVHQPPSRWKRLPVAEDAVRLGAGLSVAAIRQAPDYVAAIARVFDRLGWDPAGYELFRFAIEYPVIGTSMALVVDLPE